MKLLDPHGLQGCPADPRALGTRQAIREWHWYAILARPCVGACLPAPAFINHAISGMGARTACSASAAVLCLRAPLGGGGGVPGPVG